MLSLAKAQLQSLVEELRSHKPRSVWPKKKKKREIIGGFTGGFIGKTVGENLTTLEIFLKC